MRIVPRENEEINEVWLSDRDRFSYEGVYADDRLERPLCRVGGEWHEVDWSVALEQAAKADEEIASGHYRGPLHGIPWGAKDLLAT